MKISFWGAARTVTGSKHLIELENGKKILLDCGLFQGEGKKTISDNLFWGFEPSEIDYVLLSHAHIDHSGLLPKLVKDGFKGYIYATDATIALCKIMLLDSARIQESDLFYINKRKIEKGEPPIEPLYEEEDAMKALDLMRKFPLNDSLIIEDDIKVTTFDNGHILGSVAFLIETLNETNNVKLMFSGDIGRSNDAILNHPIPVSQADYIILESTYGSRIHDKQTDVEAKLLEVVNETCVKNKGKIIIPAFSIDRTQEIIYALDRLSHHGLLPSIEVYVDSPLSVKATKTMAAHKHYFNPEILEYITKDGDPFCFPNLHYVEHVSESKKINESKEPAIIISASGMAEAGRIKHHIKNNIEDPKNTILLIGYASPMSLAGRLKAGEPEVRIFGDTFKVKANVVSMENFSAHGDYIEMIDYLKLQNPKLVHKIFLVHGEYETQKIFAEKLIEKGYLNIEIPQKGETFNVN
jgi:metallo-beta-lactamase family protein